MWPGRLGVVFTSTIARLLLASVSLYSECTRSGRVGVLDENITSQQVIEVLLHLGADVHSLDGNNATALHLAAAKGNVSVVQVLL